LSNQRVAVYVTLRPLPEHLRPCFIVRKDGKTIVAVDPRTSFIDACACLADNLSGDEANQIRAAYGRPPRGQHLADELFERPLHLYVPPILRLHGEPPLQGGEELERRRAAGLLKEEEAMLLAEYETELEVG
jgi:hypothetical protein